MVKLGPLWRNSGRIGGNNSATQAFTILTILVAAAIFIAGVIFAVQSVRTMCCS